MTSSLQVPAEPLLQQYGEDARLCTCANDQLTLMFSQSQPFDLIELEPGVEKFPHETVELRLIDQSVNLELI